MQLIPSRYGSCCGTATPALCRRRGGSRAVWAAAARLHVVQPAVTCQIRQLEDEIGCAVCERLKRGVRLTEAGQAFLEEARRLLSHAGHASRRKTRDKAPFHHRCEGAVPWEPIAFSTSWHCCDLGGDAFYAITPGQGIGPQNGEDYGHGPYHCQDAPATRNPLRV
jgi:Bacterial regulatory helix-turn-helix protein, lysR family